MLNACIAHCDELPSWVRVRSVGASVVAPLTYVLLSCLFGSSGGEAGPLVYKCKSAEGHSYQSLPCDGSELKRWSADIAPVNEDARRHLEAIQHQLQRDNSAATQAVRPGRRRVEAVPKVSACEKARQGRERAYAKAGLRRNFAMSSFWDNKVHQVCR